MISQGQRHGNVLSFSNDIEDFNLRRNRRTCCAFSRIVVLSAIGFDIQRNHCSRARTPSDRQKAVPSTRDCGTRCKAWYMDEGEVLSLETTSYSIQNRLLTGARGNLTLTRDVSQEGRVLC